MRKFVWALVICLALSAILVAADGGQATCTDSDNGGADPEPYIGIRGSVTYGITEKFDTCISAEGGYHYENSSWIREYYCANLTDFVQRTSKDYDCTRYGYTMCQDGKCIGKVGGPGNVTHRVTSSGPNCGNKVVDAGEQCDPPDKICYLNDVIGQCTRPNAQGFGGCQCEVYKGAKTTTAETTQTVAPAPVTPPPATTTPPAQVTPPPATTQPVVQPSAQTTTQTETERAPLPTELDNSNGVGITRGITNAVKSFFKWIGSWFG